MQIAVIRHLPTEWNQIGVLQGSRDIPISPLTEESLCAIQLNKRKLKNFEPVDLVLTSSLIRTHETAKCYGYDSFTVEPLLNELNFGDYEGVPKSILMEDYSDMWINSPRGLTLGEPLIVFEKRIVTFLNKYKNYSNVIIFGHGSWIRALLSISRYGTLDHMNKVEVKNNDLNIVDFSKL
jgi:broad specificity phosphatase PhoE